MLKSNWSSNVSEALSYTKLFIVNDTDKLCNNYDYPNVKCTLNISRSGALTVLPIEGDFQEISTFNRNHCYHCTNGDTVNLKIVSYQLKSDDTLLATGIIEGIIDSSFQTIFEHKKSVTVLCRADTVNKGLMIPLNPQLPKIFICLHTKTMVDDSKAKTDPLRKLKIVRFLDNQTIFKVNVVKNKNENFKEKITGRMRYPYGRVAGVSSKTGIELVEHIFDFVPFQPSPAYINSIVPISAKCSVDKYCFTIDTSGCTYMDDAFSLNIDENDAKLSIGVHIADVSAYIKPGKEGEMFTDPQTPNDCAFLNGNSVYCTNPSSNKCYHMLPKAFRDQLSINLEKVSDVVTVYLTIDKSSGEITQQKVVREQVVSKFKFTYEDVHNIAKFGALQFWYNEIGKSVGPRFKARSWSLLRKVEGLLGKMEAIATKMRCRRLGRRFWLTNKPANIGQLIVEELMIQTNGVVGQLIKSQFGDNIPIYVQKHNHSSHGFSSAENMDGHVFIREQIWWNVIEKLISNEVAKAMNIMKEELEGRHLKYVYNQRYPNKSEYQVLAKCGAVSSRHPVTNIDPYVHFTSPIRRYMDIVVHRLLLEAERLSNEHIEYSCQKLNLICVHCNRMKIYKKEFEASLHALHASSKFSKQPKWFDAMVCAINGDTIGFQFPGLDEFVEQMTTLHYSYMSLSKYLIEGRNQITFHWNHEIYDCSNKRYDHITKFDESKFVRFSESEYMEMMQALDSFNDDVSRNVIDQFVAKHCKQSSQSKYLTQSKKQLRQTSYFAGKHIEATCFIGTFFRVQLNFILSEGIQCPSIQLLKLTDDFSVCMEHQIDPFLSFGVSTDVSCKSNVKYKKIEQYQRHWIPLVNMDAVYSAVHSKTNIRIVNVLVEEWHRMNDKEISCTFKLPKRFCIEEQIYFNKSFQEVKQNLKCSIALDYFCIEVPCDGWTWVAHCTSTRVEDLKDLNFTKFHCTCKTNSKTQAMPPISVFEDEQNCTIEIFANQVRSRRIQEMLFDLKNATPLTIAIAMKQRNYLDEVYLNYRDEDVQVLLDNDKKSNLNDCQLDAIRRSFHSRFSFIWGPPGTGKTKTSIQLALAFININKKKSSVQGSKRRIVLYCAQSNKAVDVAARFFLNDCQTSNINIVRVYSRVTEYSEPDCQLPFHKNRNVQETFVDHQLNAICMHNRIRNIDSGNPCASRVSQSYRNMIEIADDFRRNRLTKSPEDFNELCKKIAEYKDCRKEAEHWEFENADAIFMTCMSATANRMQLGSKNTKYTVEQVIIDEAGVCSELETLYPISQTCCSQVVLIGDHQQLAPVVKCKILEELGMGRSLFERYVVESKIDPLEMQFRMHEKIMEFPSSQFYRNKLKIGNVNEQSRDSTFDIWPHKSVPLVFVNCIGHEQVTMITTHDVSEMSYSNETEADIAVDVASSTKATLDISNDLQVRIVNKLMSNGVKIPQIAIISPYRNQLKHIRQKVSNKLTAITIEKSQGDEWDYVVFSTVRSKSSSKNLLYLNCISRGLGIVADYRRINVAITRSKRGLIIVGNAQVLSNNTTWRDFIAHCTHLRSFVNACDFV